MANCKNCKHWDRDNVNAIEDPDGTIRTRPEDSEVGAAAVDAKMFADCAKMNDFLVSDLDDVTIGGEVFERDGETIEAFSYMLGVREDFSCCYHEPIED